MNPNNPVDPKILGKINRVSRLLKDFGIEVPRETSERYTKVLMKKN